MQALAASDLQYFPLTEKNSVALLRDGSQVITR
jgi:hypothetical protein